MLGFKVKEKIGIGYAYELGNSDISSFTGQTHEIHIGYHLGTKKEHAEPVSSFIKSHRKSADERAADAERRRQERLQALQDTNEPEDDATTDDQTTDDTTSDDVTDVVVEDNQWENVENTAEPLSRSNNGVQERGVRFERVNEQGVKEVVVSWIPEPEAGQGQTWEIANPEEPPLERTNPDGTKEVGIKWLVTDDQGSKRMVIKWSQVGDESANNIGDNNVNDRLEDDQSDDQTISDTNTGQASNEELGNSNAAIRVKRGNHFLELPDGNHVIAGAFSEFQHAENYSDELFNKGFHDVIVGYVSARGYYYTVVFRSDSFDQAEAQKNRLKRREGFEDVWVLTVE